MRSTLSRRYAALAAVVAACGKGDADAVDTARSTPSPAAAARAQVEQGQRNACRLLTGQEVTALVENPVGLANRTVEEQGYSECQWEDSAGSFLFGIKAYWVGGRQNFGIWRKAQRLTDDIFEKQEGVRTDDIVKQGPVAGLGDAAYFSEIFPSLLLEGDMMLELTMQLVPKADRKFRPLATTLLTRLK